MAVICEIGAYIVIIILIYLVIYGRMNCKTNSYLLGGFDDGSDFKRGGPEAAAECPEILLSGQRESACFAA